MMIGRADVHTTADPSAVAWICPDVIAVDADGSPRAYRPDGSGLDYNANARDKSSRWVGVATVDGNPVIQSDTDPSPGSYVSPTALRDPSRPHVDPRAYVDSEAVPYMAIGGLFLSRVGASMGDLGYAIDTTTGAESGFIVADSPGRASLRAHEMSIALVRRLGYDGDARGRGRVPAGGTILLILFPGSGAGWPRQTAEAEAAALYTAAGGRGWAYTLAGLDAPTPTAGGSVHHGLIIAGIVAVLCTVGIIAWAVRS